MVIVKLMGGLGNQMFQYALGRHLSLRLNTSLKFDLQELLDRTPREQFTYRNYELHVFGIEAAQATSGELSRFTPAYRPPAWQRLLSAVGVSGGPCRKVVERGVAFDPAILGQRGNLLLDGYWQSEKYFAAVAGTIRDDFRFRDPMDGKNALLAAEISRTESVSIHVRRGDYLTNPFHGVCSPAYYQEAIARIAAKTAAPRFFVFSDDPDWAQQHIPLPHKGTFVAHNQEGSSYADMRLMSLCKHNIIANSSFSWWGAWLNGNPGKIVIAPKHWLNPESSWFKAQQIDLKDILPDAWIKL